MKNILLFIFISIFYANDFDELYFGTDDALDIITWNIEWFPKNGNVTVDYVTQIIEAIDVDVIAMQELDDRNLFDQMLNELNEYNGYYESTWFAGLAYIYNKNTVQINNIYEIFTTSPFWSPFPRSPMVMDMNFMNENYIIINNHFKCCGDGVLDSNNSNDEENRRLQAITYLKEFLDDNFSNAKVVLLGDLNDDLSDTLENNVFQFFIDDNENYQFVDMQISQGSSLNWSYPTWPSHLDHILISNELFEDFQNQNSLVSVIKIDEYMGGWNNYDSNVSDLRPIGIKLSHNKVNLNPDLINYEKKYIKAVNILGADLNNNYSGLIIQFFDDGSVEKKYIFK